MASGVRCLPALSSVYSFGQRPRRQNYYAMFNFESIVDIELQKRKRRAWALTPEQRLARFVALQAAAESTLASNPEALAAFHRRNRRQRRESRVRLLERQLRLDDSKASVE